MTKCFKSYFPLLLHKLKFTFLGTAHIPVLAGQSTCNITFCKDSNLSEM